MNKTTGHGFTLVELIVVVGIIALLIGLLLSVLQPARQLSKRVVCLAQLRDRGLGFQMYRDQHNGQLPVVQSMPVDPTRPSILDEMASFIPKGESWKCPSDSAVYEEFGTSYEYFAGFILALIPDQNRLFDDTRVGSVIPLSIDADGWHPGGPDGSDRNALFFDGHADWYVMQSFESSNTSDGSQAETITENLHP